MRTDAAMVFPHGGRVARALERERSPVARRVRRRSRRGAGGIDARLGRFPARHDVAAYAAAYTGFLRGVSEPVVRASFGQPDGDVGTVECLIEPSGPSAGRAGALPLALHPGGRPVDPSLNGISNSTSMAAGANCEPQRQTTCLNCLAVVRVCACFSVGGRHSVAGWPPV